MKNAVLLFLTLTTASAEIVLKPHPRLALSGARDVRALYEHDAEFRSLFQVREDTRDPAAAAGCRAEAFREKALADGRGSSPTHHGAGIHRTWHAALARRALSLCSGVSSGARLDRLHRTDGEPVG